MQKLSIIIPALNEEKTIEKMLEMLMKVNFTNKVRLELVIINDYSTDSTGAIIDQLDKGSKQITALHNEVHLGKSQSVRKGLLKSTGDCVVIQDADTEYEPNDLDRMLELMLNDSLDIVYGNRFGKRNKVIYPTYYIGNRLLSTVSNLFTYPRIKTWIPDMEVCYKLMNGNIAREIAEKLTATSTFGVEPEITAKLSRYTLDGKHLRFGIVPISYTARSKEEGKKIRAIRDGLLALKEIIYYNIV